VPPAIRWFLTKYTCVSLRHAGERSHLSRFFLLIRL